MKTTVKQWALLTVLCIWGLIAFVFLCGEENPNMPLSVSLFLLIKAIAFVNLLACVLIGKHLNKKGWLPNLEKHFGN